MSDNIVSSRGVSLFFAAVFGVLSGAHLVLMLWKRNWLILWLIIGGILELSGYAEKSAGNGSQSVQVIIAPIFLAASVYLSFGKLARKLDAEKISSSRSHIQSAIFVTGDVVSLGLQISGIVLGFMDEPKSLGKILVIIGFVLQLVSLFVFTYLVAKEHKRLSVVLLTPSQGIHSWKSYVIVIYIVLFLLFARYVYRVIEYAQGFGGYIFRHAVFAYILDGGLMALLMLLLCIIHPGFVYSNIDSQGVGIGKHSDCGKP